MKLISFIYFVVIHKIIVPIKLTGEKWLYGCWFYRPNETFHLATRKFLEKEVFKSDYYNKAPISKILGKCVVMFVKVKATFVLRVCFIIIICFPNCTDQMFFIMCGTEGVLQTLP